jgi:hypothetical protein
MSPLQYEIATNENHPVGQRILDLNSTMANVFPELRGVILRIENCKASGHVASYEWHTRRIEMQFRFFEKDKGNTLPFVLAHETMHAVQWIRRAVPYGERSCDIFTLARLPLGLFPTKKAFYVKVPQSMLSNPERIRETAKEAITLRKSGLRFYIAWFENELRAAQRNKL